MALLHSPVRRYGGYGAYGARGAVPAVEALPMRIFGTVKESFVDGPGVRFVIFVQGCPHHCPGCHNPGSHDPAGGTPTTADELWREIEKRSSLVTGVTFSGGEPFIYARELAQIGAAARAAGLNVMTYSGWTYEELIKMAAADSGVRSLLTVSDYLVDSPFILEKRTLELPYRGSSNQRFLDIRGYPTTTNILNA